MNTLSHSPSSGPSRSSSDNGSPSSPDSPHSPHSHDAKPLPHAEGENCTNALNNDIDWEPAPGVEQDDGVTRIEALYIVYGKGWGLFALWA